MADQLPKVKTKKIGKGYSAFLAASERLYGKQIQQSFGGFYGAIWEADDARKVTKVTLGKRMVFCLRFGRIRGSSWLLFAEDLKPPKSGTAGGKIAFRMFVRDKICYASMSLLFSEFFDKITALKGDKDPMLALLHDSARRRPNLKNR